ncbi:MerR family transcriptional regulator [Streptomyces sp. BK239]|uniref:MerR family transcriptional regulator n=1 Tax=Streptomyces sp. BK239 TaxID=2512155 RepID=UPI00102B1D28|nr:MerR family transcriptional regulator [Streptomyces sp. BK239]RZU25042.1 DNA-binding transcriptional MerR regulator [Streptomyces sp. BK239]
MLSISDFSEMCDLPPQTLRYYHAAGLLVPADVDERTGYRSYTFGQVERAMLITVLRGTGMSVTLVRRALDQPDEALILLRQHVTEVRQQRQTQDEDIRDARELLASPPEAVLRHVDEMTVASKLVPRPAGRNRYDWNAADAAVTSAVQEVVRTVVSCGAVVTGTSWRTLAAGTPEQKSRIRAGEGPHWLVRVPVEADEKTLASLPADIEVETFEARDELSIFMPGKSSMAKHGTALSRLLAYPFDAAYVDTFRMRHLLHPNGVETAMAVCEFREPSAVE